MHIQPYFIASANERLISRRNGHCLGVLYSVHDVMHGTLPNAWCIAMFRD